MAFGNRELTKTDLFIKSAAADMQDPTFLTFTIDFFPVPEEYPRYDGLWNSSLLPTDQSWFNAFSSNSTPPKDSPSGSNPGVDQVPQIGIDQYKNVEFSAYEWLLAYYGPNYGGQLNQRTPHPAQALVRFAKELSVIQDAPWYFQSIAGIPDLWKQAHRVKEGDMKTTLTVNCLESVRKPLTTIAENYRWAVYDHERLSYRLPDNLRWFDMQINLIEGRYLVDHEGRFPFLQFGKSNKVKLYEYGNDNKLKRGLKVTTFKCKMCEFDFSDFLSSGGAKNEFSAITPTDPFSPAFKINVGWTIHEEVNYEDAELMRQSNILSGALNAIGNKLTNALGAATNLPNAIAGSIVNKVQTTIEKAALGNVYNASSANGLAGAINQFGSALGGRLPPVGPGIASAVNTKIYPNPNKPATVRADGLGDAYPDPPRPGRVGINDIGDTYPEPPRPDQISLNDLGDTYPAPPRQDQTSLNLGDTYPDQPGPDQVGPNDLGDVYP